MRGISPTKVPLTVRKMVRIPATPDRVQNEKQRRVLGKTALF